MTPAHVGRILARLQDVRTAGEGWQARCPSHDDQSPSLSLSIGHDDRLLFNCHAGCAPSDFLDALGLEWKDVFPGATTNRVMTTTTTNTVSGTRTFEIRDADGRLVAVHHRQD